MLEIIFRKCLTKSCKKLKFHTMSDVRTDIARYRRSTFSISVQKNRSLNSSIKDHKIGSSKKYAGDNIHKVLNEVM